MSFLKDIAGRDGKWSSKKVYYNLACLMATGCLGYITYRGMTDTYYIVLYSIYLACLGGFEIIPKILGMVLQLKNGQTTTTTTATFQETSEPDK